MNTHSLSLALTLTVAVPCAMAGQQPPAIVIQHMSTAFAGQGMCAVRFSVETFAGDGDAGTVTLSLVFRDRQNKQVARGQLAVALNDSTAGRYQEPVLEGPEFCLDSDTSVVVTKAKSEHEGKTHDLLQLKKVRVSTFKPYPITLHPVGRANFRVSG